MRSGISFFCKFCIYLVFPSLKFFTFASFFKTILRELINVELIIAELIFADEEWKKAYITE